MKVIYGALFLVACGGAQSSTSAVDMAVGEDGPVPGEALPDMADAVDMTDAVDMVMPSDLFGYVGGCYYLDKTCPGVRGLTEDCYGNSVNPDFYRVNKCQPELECTDNPANTADNHYSLTYPNDRHCWYPPGHSCGTKYDCAWRLGYTQACTSGVCCLVPDADAGTAGPTNCSN